MSSQEIIQLKQAKRILITGDAGRGKTTFACEFSKKLKLPCYSVDTYQWKIKYTKQHDRQKVVEQLREIYQKDVWIVEGTTKELIEDGIDRADIIYYFCFDSLLVQWASILRRYVKNREGSVKSLIVFLRHVVYKRFHLGYMREEKTVKDILTMDERTVMIHSFRQWRNVLEKL